MHALGATNRYLGENLDGLCYAESLARGQSAWCCQVACVTCGWGRVGNRVLQVVTDRDRRGAQVFAVDLSSHLRSRGVETETIALWNGTSERSLDVPALSGRHNRLTSVRALRRRMRSVDVVVAHGSDTLMATALAGQGLDTRIVYRQISDLNYWAGTPFRRARVRAYLRRMSHAVALWDGSAHVLIEGFGVSSRRISIIPNGVPAGAFWPASTAERNLARRRFGLATEFQVALCVSALVPEKGVALAIEAVSQVPRVILLIAGQGPQLRELQDLAAKLCPGRVRFVGALDDVRSAYHAAEVLVFPSLTEAMPAVLIEAGLSGLPVVATRVGAIPTMVRDGETGFLVNPDATEIAGRVAQSLRSSELGVEARTHCLARYSLEHVGEAWLAVLEAQSRSSLATVG